ncbi:MAG TPA: hypothetical protein VFS87_02570 [Qipengyuania sp.]|nr:hypothetical protein [Qipengyuania sp.]
MISVLAALTLVAAPSPALAPPQVAALRCGVVFALGARMQADGKPAAAAWPALATRGREYFVRVFVKLMDDMGASRDQLVAMAERETSALKGDAAVAAAMPACLPLLDAAGV